MAAALFVSVLVLAACGLVYELVASALASYLLGDSITQFSTVIGAYLCAMGLGSWLSRYVTGRLAERFVTIEFLLALVGGFSSTALFLAFAYTEAFRPLLYGLVTIVGTLVGLEIPLLMRLLRERYSFKDVVANVLTFDYLGALAASLLFPLLLVPRLGLVRSAVLFGILNAAVGLWSTHLFTDQLPRRRALRLQGALVLGVLVAAMFGAERLTRAAEDSIYADQVVFSRSTRYQRIVLTAWQDDLRLFLNGHLQFSSRDEYRYHEALVHPGLAGLAGARRVLILGGGDGLAAREVLRYPQVTSVTLVDLDAEMTGLFAKQPALTALNGGSLTDRRLRVVNADAFPWLDRHAERYDFIVADFPDPSSYSVGKLYTGAFYRLLARHLAPGGRFVVQSTSPLFARRAFWCIARTIGDAGLAVTPYHLYVPSFGEWGFVLAGRDRYRPPDVLPARLRYLTVDALPALFVFPRDMTPVQVAANTLHDQVLVRYYLEDSERVGQ